MGLHRESEAEFYALDDGGAFAVDGGSEGVCVEGFFFWGGGAVEAVGEGDGDGAVDFVEEAGHELVGEAGVFDGVEAGDFDSCEACADACADVDA